MRNDRRRPTQVLLSTVGSAFAAWFAVMGDSGRERAGKAWNGARPVLATLIAAALATTMVSDSRPPVEPLAKQQVRADGTALPAPQDGTKDANAQRAPPRNAETPKERGQPAPPARKVSRPKAPARKVRATPVRRPAATPQPRPVLRDGAVLLVNHCTGRAAFVTPEQTYLVEVAPDPAACAAQRKPNSATEPNASAPVADATGDKAGTATPPQGAATRFGKERVRRAPDNMNPDSTNPVNTRPASAKPASTKRWRTPATDRKRADSAREPCLPHRAAKASARMVPCRQAERDSGGDSTVTDQPADTGKSAGTTVTDRRGGARTQVAVPRERGFSRGGATAGKRAAETAPADSRPARRAQAETRSLLRDQEAGARNRDRGSARPTPTEDRPLIEAPDPKSAGTPAPPPDPTAARPAPAERTTVGSPDPPAVSGTRPPGVRRDEPAQAPQVRQPAAQPPAVQPPAAAPVEAPRGIHEAPPKIEDVRSVEPAGAANPLDQMSDAELAQRLQDLVDSRAQGKPIDPNYAEENQIRDLLDNHGFQGDIGLDRRSQFRGGEIEVPASKIVKGLGAVGRALSKVVPDKYLDYLNGWGRIAANPYTGEVQLGLGTSLGVQGNPARVGALPRAKDGVSVYVRAEVDFATASKMFDLRSLGPVQLGGDGFAEIYAEGLYDGNGVIHGFGQVHVKVPLTVTRGNVSPRFAGNVSFTYDTRSGEFKMRRAGVWGQGSLPNGVGIRTDGDNHQGMYTGPGLKGGPAATVDKGGPAFKITSGEFQAGVRGRRTFHNKTVAQALATMFDVFGWLGWQQAVAGEQLEKGWEDLLDWVDRSPVPTGRDLPESWQRALGVRPGDGQPQTPLPPGLPILDEDGEIIGYTNADDDGQFIGDPGEDAKEREREREANRDSGQPRSGEDGGNNDGTRDNNGAPAGNGGSNDDARSNDGARDDNGAPASNDGSNDGSPSEGGQNDASQNDASQNHGDGQDNRGPSSDGVSASGSISGGGGGGSSVNGGGSVNGDGCGCGAGPDTDTSSDGGLVSDGMDGDYSGGVGNGGIGSVADPGSDSGSDPGSDGDGCGCGSDTPVS